MPSSPRGRAKSPAPPRFFASAAAWRKWLAANHARETELVVGFHKRATGTAGMTWSDSVDEALCFGWIDAVRRSGGADTYTIRFCRRKPTSIWSKINVAKVEALRAAGKMTAAGEAAFAHRTDARTGVYSFERNRAAEWTSEQAAELRANAAAAEYFASRPPWYQRTAMHWVQSAKQPVTRAKRFAQLVADSELGVDIKPLRRTRAIE